MIPGVCSNFNAKASTESVFHPSVILRSFYESHNGGSYVALSYHIKTNKIFFHLQARTSEMCLLPLTGLRYADRTALAKITQCKRNSRYGNKSLMLLARRFADAPGLQT
ncbi:hypothetical protein X801_06055 [Opisthorchis viverrini]|uniref:Uncharacterized protein n=1 Tax=Opisthorchis viverrini TaxID=6198 RepID=A0A1S8WU96_OPIVI|nr:hypothetical protein X801_06055 [Opisthorchis viverrini]